MAASIKKAANRLPTMPACELACSGLIDAGILWTRADLLAGAGDDASAALVLVDGGLFLPVLLRETTIGIPLPHFLHLVLAVRVGIFVSSI